MYTITTVHLDFFRALQVSRPDTRAHIRVKLLLKDSLPEGTIAAALVVDAAEEESFISYPSVLPWKL